MGRIWFVDVELKDDLDPDRYLDGMRGELIGAIQPEGDRVVVLRDFVTGMVHAFSMKTHNITHIGFGSMSNGSVAPYDLDEEFQTNAFQELLLK